jgi:hypothetical protein
MKGATHQLKVNFWGLLFHWDLNCIREIYFAQNKNQRNYSNTKKFTA